MLQFAQRSDIIGLADVVKLVDTLDLGSSAERCAGSSPSIRTIRSREIGTFFILKRNDSIYACYSTGNRRIKWFNNGGN